ncbi:hypothetical protein DERP_002359 [Dermatophagoides pteronyssinus]|uniref:Uncharacterized protein n=1 Tax=Dermatophagoides pteronyssinus TaxID=6956 RepID=A0ABQ8JI04_DERPT|nr:hypothetical protein DERP_002359 [Dermatophagoides pteronyssinus]
MSLQYTICWLLFIVDEDDDNDVGVFFVKKSGPNIARNINIGFVRRFLVRTDSFRISIGRLIPFKRKYNPHALQTDSPIRKEKLEIYSIIRFVDGSLCLKKHK